VNALWMSWRLWQDGSEGPAAWLLPELLLVLAALPLTRAVLGPRVSFWEHGAVALRVLLRALGPFLLLAGTALVALVLACYAQRVMLALVPEKGWLEVGVQVLGGLALAMLRCWLCLAALLVLLRYGFPRSSLPAEAA
jgi:hypothetical protein